MKLINSKSELNHAVPLPIRRPIPLPYQVFEKIPFAGQKLIAPGNNAGGDAKFIGQINNFLL